MNSYSGSALLLQLDSWLLIDRIWITFSPLRYYFLNFYKELHGFLQNFTFKYLGYNPTEILCHLYILIFFCHSYEGQNSIFRLTYQLRIRSIERNKNWIFCHLSILIFFCHSYKSQNSIFRLAHQLRTRSTERNKNWIFHS